MRSTASALRLLAGGDDRRDRAARSAEKFDRFLTRESAERDEPIHERSAVPGDLGAVSLPRDDVAIRTEAQRRGPRRSRWRPSDPARGLAGADGRSGDLSGRVAWPGDGRERCRRLFARTACSAAAAIPSAGKPEEIALPEEPERPRPLAAAASSIRCRSRLLAPMAAGGPARRAGAWPGCGPPGGDSNPACAAGRRRLPTGIKWRRWLLTGRPADRAIIRRLQMPTKATAAPSPIA